MSYSKDSLTLKAIHKLNMRSKLRYCLYDKYPKNDDDTEIHSHFIGDEFWYFC